MAAVAMPTALLSASGYNKMTTGACVDLLMLCFYLQRTDFVCAPIIGRLIDALSNTWMFGTLPEHLDKDSRSFTKFDSLQRAGIVPLELCIKPPSL